MLRMRPGPKSKTEERKNAFIRKEVKAMVDTLVDNVTEEISRQNAAREAELLAQCRPFAVLLVRVNSADPENIPGTGSRIESVVNQRNEWPAKSRDNYLMPSSISPISSESILFPFAVSIPMDIACPTCFVTILNSKTWFLHANAHKHRLLTACLQHFRDVCIRSAAPDVAAQIEAPSLKNVSYSQELFQVKTLSNDVILLCAACGCYVTDVDQHLRSWRHDENFLTVVFPEEVSRLRELAFSPVHGLNLPAYQLILRDFLVTQLPITDASLEIVPLKTDLPLVTYVDGFLRALDDQRNSFAPTSPVVNAGKPMTCIDDSDVSVRPERFLECELCQIHCVNETEFDAHCKSYGHIKRCAVHKFVDFRSNYQFLPGQKSSLELRRIKLDGIIGLDYVFEFLNDDDDVIGHVCTICWEYFHAESGDGLEPHLKSRDHLMLSLNFCKSMLPAPSDSLYTEKVERVTSWLTEKSSVKKVAVARVSDEEFMKMELGDNVDKFCGLPLHKLWISDVELKTHPDGVSPVIKLTTDQCAILWCDACYVLILVRSDQSCGKVWLEHTLYDMHSKKVEMRSHLKYCSKGDAMVEAKSEILTALEFTGSTNTYGLEYFLERYWQSQLIDCVCRLCAKSFLSAHAAVHHLNDMVHIQHFVHLKSSKSDFWLKNCHKYLFENMKSLDEFSDNLRSLADQCHNNDGQRDPAMVSLSRQDLALFSTDVLSNDLRVKVMLLLQREKTVSESQLNGDDASTIDDVVLVDISEGAGRSIADARPVSHNDRALKFKYSSLGPYMLDLVDIDHDVTEEILKREPMLGKVGVTFRTGKSKRFARLLFNTETEMKNALEVNIPWGKSLKRLDYQKLIDEEFDKLFAGFLPVKPSENMVLLWHLPTWSEVDLKKLFFGQIRTIELAMPPCQNNFAVLHLTKPISVDALRKYVYAYGLKGVRMKKLDVDKKPVKPKPEVKTLPAVPMATLKPGKVTSTAVTRDQITAPLAASKKGVTSGVTAVSATVDIGKPIAVVTNFGVNNADAVAKPATTKPPKGTAVAAVKKKYQIPKKTIPTAPVTPTSTSKSSTSKLPKQPYSKVNAPKAAASPKGSSKSSASSTPVASKADKDGKSKKDADSKSDTTAKATSKGDKVSAKPGDVDKTSDCTLVKAGEKEKPAAKDLDPNRSSSSRKRSRSRSRDNRSDSRSYSKRRRSGSRSKDDRSRSRERRRHRQHSRSRSPRRRRSRSNSSSWITRHRRSGSLKRGRSRSQTPSDPIALHGSPVELDLLLEGETVGVRTSHTSYLMGLPVIQVSPDDVFANRYLVNLTTTLTTLIGAHKVAEYRSTDPMHEPGYLCRVCRLQLFADNIVAHLASDAHRAIYLKYYYDKYYRLISSSKNVRARSAMIEHYSTEVQTVEGKKKLGERLSIRIAPEKFQARIHPAVMPPSTAPFLPSVPPPPVAYGFGYASAPPLVRQLPHGLLPSASDMPPLMGVQPPIPGVVQQMPNFAKPPPGYGAPPPGLMMASPSMGGTASGAAVIDAQIQLVDTTPCLPGQHKFRPIVPNRFYLLMRGIPGDTTESEIRNAFSPLHVDNIIFCLKCLKDNHIRTDVRLEFTSGRISDKALESGQKTIRGIGYNCVHMKTDDPQLSPQDAEPLVDLDDASLRQYDESDNWLSISGLQASVTHDEIKMLMHPIPVKTVKLGPVTAQAKDRGGAGKPRGEAELAAQPKERSARIEFEKCSDLVVAMEREKPFQKYGIIIGYEGAPPNCRMLQTLAPLKRKGVYYLLTWPSSGEISIKDRESDIRKAFRPLKILAVEFVRRLDNKVMSECFVQFENFLDADRWKTPNRLADLKNKLGVQATMIHPLGIQHLALFKGRKGVERLSKPREMDMDIAPPENQVDEAGPSTSLIVPQPVPPIGGSLNGPPPALVKGPRTPPPPTRDMSLTDIEKQLLSQVVDVARNSGEEPEAILQSLIDTGTAPEVTFLLLEKLKAMNKTAQPPMDLVGPEVGSPPTNPTDALLMELLEKSNEESRKQDEENQRMMAVLSELVGDNPNLLAGLQASGSSDDAMIAMIQQAVSGGGDASGRSELGGRGPQAQQTATPPPNAWQEETPSLGNIWESIRQRTNR